MVRYIVSISHFLMDANGPEPLRCVPGAPRRAQRPVPARSHADTSRVDEIGSPRKYLIDTI